MITTWRAVKHNTNCQYLHDTYRVWDVKSEEEAITKCFNLTGIKCDYALKGSGAFDVGIIETDK